MAHADDLMATKRGLTSDERHAQAARCPCRGCDDYCPCQNVPDRITRREWGLDTPLRGRVTSLAVASNPDIPTALFNVRDLLKDIASGRDPHEDIAGRPLLDYWQATARRCLPALTEPSLLDEDFSNLLDFARHSADTLRMVRQEERSPSANFPTMRPVPFAQDAADLIERLVSTIEARATAASPAPSLEIDECP